ncbi:MAG: SIMPL domain-containing protein [Algisphaera sp.]
MNAFLSRLILTMIIAVLGVPLGHAGHDDDDLRRSIDVTGTATIRVSPDFVEWRVSLIDQGMDAQKMKRANDTRAEAMAELRSELRVDDADFEMGRVSVERQYRRDRQTEERIFTGYRMEREVVLRQRSLDDFDDFLEGVARGGNSFTMTSRSTQEKELRWQARLDAVAVARDKAVAMAAVLDAEIGPPLHISAKGPRSLASMQSNRVFLTEALAVSTEDYHPGQIEITAAVSVRFELK